MIVIAGSFKSYGVLTRPGKPTGKARTERHTIDTIRYNGYSTSGRRSSSRHLCGQFNQSRGRLVQASPRIVKKHCRVTNAGVQSRLRGMGKYSCPLARSGESSSTRARVLAHATRPTRYWLPSTDYFACGGSPQSRFRFVSKQHASLTFEKEKQSCTKF